MSSILTEEMRSSMVIGTEEEDSCTMAEWTGQTIPFVEPLPKKTKDQPCMTADPVPLVPKGKWSMDTGCAYDLFSHHVAKDGQMRQVDKEESITCSTANGKNRANDVVPMMCEELGTLVEPYVLAETPSVLSIGRR